MEEKPQADNDADENDSLYSEKDDPDPNHSIIDVISTPTHNEKSGKFFDASGSTPKNDKPGPSKSRVKCPCGKSDKQSSYVICAKCKQQWHQKCCNLIGLDSAAIKKLEVWQCPRCYTCPLLCRQPASLFAEMSTMKEQMKKLLDKNTHRENCQNLNAEISALKEQVSELVAVSKENEVKVNLSPTLDEAIQNVCKLSPEVVTNIESNLSNLTKQVTSLQTHIQTSAAASSRCSTTCSSNQTERHPNAAFSPNTRSPRLREIKTPCEPYIKYAAGAVSPLLKNSLTQHINDMEAEFKPVGEGSREVLYYGEHAYNYTGHKHEKREMPDVIKSLLQEASSCLPEDSKLNINSCLVTKYNSGENHIPLHRDDEPVIDPESEILTVSLGANRMMTFENNDKSTTKELLLEDSSVLITSRFAQDFWKHGILPDKSQGQRVSFTFRKIAPYYLNSTIILGDSNTAKLNFGTGSGTLGAWVPGKRIKVGHIEALPEATDIGPFRNIVIHTGINSINTNYHRKSDAYLIHFLETKCREILSVYPKSKIHISMLLPTRLGSLNHQVDLFNHAILDMSYRMKNVRIIDNSIFGSVLTNEFGRWNVNEQRPFTADALHLGRKGIRTLATNFKSAVLGNSKGQSRSRFNTSGGSYRQALERTEHRDGYQAPR